MDIITVASPDRMSISAWLRYMRPILNSNYVVAAMHSLMSPESIQAFIDGVLEVNTQIIFTYYAKRKINMDPHIVIPEYLKSISGGIIWMSLYSLDWDILKDTEGFLASHVGRWKQLSGT